MIEINDIINISFLILLIAILLILYLNKRGYFEKVEYYEDNNIENESQKLNQ